MATKINNDTSLTSPLTGEDVELIIKSSDSKNGVQYDIEDYIVSNASDKMLGFLGDYWKLKVYLSSSNNEKQVRQFFIKAIPRSNEAKAAMVKDIQVFDSEITFYTDIKVKLDFPGLKPWCPKLVAALNDAMIFEDLNAMGYKLNDKFQRLDQAHALQGLRTLARLHASSIILEETKKAELNRPYCLTEDYETISNEAGYKETDPWYKQCRAGALEAIKAYSKYGQTDVLQKIEVSWVNVWNAALQISGCSKDHRNVLCHRDLWNNNIFFHYKEVSGDLEPDDCVLVDFQAIRYQPPACDIMLFLHCNLTRKLREDNMGAFLDFYYEELKAILHEHDININGIICKKTFIKSAEQQRQWGLIAFACLAPCMFIDDDVVTRIFTDTKQFDQIMNKDKGSFIKTMMEKNEEYRNILLETFEEVVERYCL